MLLIGDKNRNTMLFVFRLTSSRFKETPLHKACFNNSLRIMLITLLIEVSFSFYQLLSS